MTIAKQILIGQPAVLGIDDAAALMGLKIREALQALGPLVFRAEGEICVLREDLAAYWERRPGETWIGREIVMGWSRRAKPVTIVDDFGLHHFESVCEARRTFGSGVDRHRDGKRRKYKGLQVLPGIVRAVDRRQLLLFDAAMLGAAVAIGVRR